MKLMNTIRCLIATSLLLTISFALTQVAINVQGQANKSDDSCPNIQHLIANNSQEFSINESLENNGVLVSGSSISATLAANVFVHTWVLSVASENTSEIVIAINKASDNLEFALFKGIDALSSGASGGDFLEVDGQNHRFNVSEGGLYTLAIRRSPQVWIDTDVNYELRTDFEEGAMPDFPETFKLPRFQESYPFRIVNGVSENRFTYSPTNDIENVIARVNAGSLGSVYQSSIEGGASTRDELRLFFNPDNQSEFRFADWVEEISLIGGSLYIKGMYENQERSLFIADFSPGKGMQATDTLLRSIEDARDTLVSVDWRNITAIWILQDCVGFQRNDGRYFSAELDNTIGMELELKQEQDENNLFEISLKWQASDGSEKEYKLKLEWSLISETTIDSAAQVRLQNGVFKLDMLADRQLGVEAGELNVQKLEGVEALGDGSQPIKATVNPDDIDEAITIKIDWFNLYRFQLLEGLEESDSTIELIFRDAQGVRDDPNHEKPSLRPGTNLKLFEALDELIHIVYTPQDGENYAVERVLLPSDESYIELVMKNGTPPYDSTAYSNEDGYSPRALNNTGAECFPFNTFLSQINCGANGDINPANGNIWYAVTDHQAGGLLIDLMLSRSYNSRLAHLDGAFGFGWTAGIQHDYVVGFNDPETNANGFSRLVNLADDKLSYGMALDLTWSPGGFVTFTTPSGSQHLFVRQNLDQTVQEYRAVTMPGWILERDNLRDKTWRLQEESGLEYEFDRAGRLLGYGYRPNNDSEPDTGWVKIAYANEEDFHLNGLGHLGSDVIILTDAASLRQIELYYDENAHVVRSILRDLQQSTSLAETCNLDENCFEIQYTYHNGTLVQVKYPDGYIAEYRYHMIDDSALLTRYKDVRAPLLPSAEYDYEPDYHYAISIAALAPDTSLDTAPSFSTWRSLNPSRTNNRLVVDVQDEFGSTTQLRYQIETNDVNIKNANNTYTLISTQNLLSDLDPQEISWENGFPSAIGKLTYNNVIHLQNTTTLKLDSHTGQINSIEGPYGYVGGASYPGYKSQLNDALFEDLHLYRPNLVNISGQSGFVFEYNSIGQVKSIKTVEGADKDADIEIVWDEARNLPIQIIKYAEQSVIYDYTEPSSQIGFATTLHYYSEITGENSYDVKYRYDALGRITAIYDSTLEGGLPDEDGLPWSYYLDYQYEEGSCADSQQNCLHRVVEVTDPLGAITRYSFNEQAQLLSVKVMAGNDTLRETSYEYAPYILDNGNANPFYGRLTQIRWHNPESVDRVISYQYHMLDNGEGMAYEIVFTESNGDQTVYKYDYQHRLVSILNPFHEERVFSYTYNDNPDLQNPINIIVTESNTFRNYRIEYHFDFGRRLREVDYFTPGRRNPNYIWTLSYRFPKEGEDIPSILQYQITELQLDVYYQDNSKRSTIHNQVWDSTRSDWVAVKYDDVEIEAATQLEGTGFGRFSLSEIRDKAGRVTSRRLEDGTFQQKLYCYVGQGHLQVLEYISSSLNSFNCDNLQNIETGQNYTRLVIYDAHQRPLCIHEQGIPARHFKYGLGSEPYQRELIVTSGHGSSCANPTASDSSQTYIYNAVGDLLSWTDASGFTRTVQYDKLGQIIRVEIPNGSETPYEYLFEYNADGTISYEKDALGNKFRYSYDRGLLILKENQTRNQTFSYIYDENGRLISLIDSAGRVLRYQYNDPLSPSRITNIIDEAGSNHTYQWNDIGTEITYIDPLLHPTTYGFDTNGLLWRIQDARDNTFLINYDAQGRISNWVQGYNGAEEPRTIFLNYPDTNKIQVSFADSAQSTTLTTLPDMQLAQVNTSESQLNMSYDAWHRQDDISYANQNFNFEYDPLNPVLTISNVGRFQFDGLNRLWMFEHPDDGRLTYTYDNTGYHISYNDKSLDIDNIIRERVSDQADITIATDDGSRELSFFLNPRLLIDRISYDVNVCQLQEDDEQENCDTQETWSSHTRFAYHNNGLPTIITDPQQNVETYSYDEFGNLTTYQTIARDNFNYDYDELNRLVRIVGPGGITIWLDYTSVGNQVKGICRSQLGIGNINSYRECADDEEPNGTVLETYTYNNIGQLLSQQFETLDHGPLVLSEQNLISAYSNIETPNDAAYTFDEQQRLSTISFADQTYSYTYRPEGFVLKDDTNNYQIAYNLDKMNLLNSIEYGSEPEESVTVKYNLPDATTVEATVKYSEISSDYLTFDAAGVIQKLIFLEDELNLDYLRNAYGATKQLAIKLLDSEDTYLQVITYNKNQKPTAMQLSFEGQVLYTVIYSYNQWGQLLEEFKQVPGLGQEQVIYHYGEATNKGEFSPLLSSTDIKFEKFTPQSGQNPLLTFFWLIPIGGLVILRSGRYRRQILVGSVMLTLVLGFVFVGQANDSITINYSYNAAGHIARISSDDCELSIDYTYDEVGRLITQKVNDTPQFHYRYDVFNRLVQINSTKLYYVGQSRTPIAINVDGKQNLFAQTRDGIRLFSMTSGNVLPITYDGTGRDLSAPVASDSEIPLWVFDPHLNPLFLDTNSEADLLSACRWSDTRQESTMPIIIVADDLIWHPQSGLFFQNGRAYNAQIGRFLQRDLLGPDVMGNLYEYPTQDIQLPIRYWQPPHFHGLDMLKQASDNTNMIQDLTAEVVRSEMLPDLGVSLSDPLLLGLSQQPQQIEQMLNRQVDLVNWLHQSYNYDTLRIDPLTAAVRLPSNRNPGQGGWENIYNAAPVRNPQSISYSGDLGQGLSSLQSALMGSQPQINYFTTYLVDAWRPDLLIDMRGFAAPQPLMIESPSDVLDWLPQVINPDNVEIANQSLDVIEDLENIQLMTIDDWYLRQLNLNLPDSPPKIPTQLEDIKAQWFTNDILGREARLGQLWNSPTPPDAPGYSLWIGDTITELSQPDLYPIEVPNYSFGQ